MKKLTKRQLNKIANMHAAGLLLASESSVSFTDSNLSHEEYQYLDEKLTSIALNLLYGEEPIYTSDAIVDFVRENRK